MQPERDGRLDKAIATSNKALQRDPQLVDAYGAPGLGLRLQS